MNLDRVNQIAKAVLYEGYMLYPYRPSSVKNRQRWNFGVLYPQAYGEAQGGDEPSSMRTECLISGSKDTILAIRLRFLHLRTRSSGPLSQPGGSLPDGWQEAVEREVSLPERALEEYSRQARTHIFAFPAETRSDIDRNPRGGDADVVLRQQAALEGSIDVTVEQVREGLFKLSVLVRNTTPLEDPAVNRDDALIKSLVSTHTVLGVERGEFVSLLEPPEESQDLVAQCQNVGAWPVLVGDAGERDTLLASPIILYDYPQIAPESAGDLFDGTEIDEILSLRIMTLTEEEKREIRQSDDRARQILERTDALPPEQFMKLHGAVRGMRPLKENNP